MKHNWDMKQIWAKTRTRIDPLMLFLKEKIHPSYIFIVLTIFLLVSLGILWLMRAITDDYTTVSVDFIHIALTTFIWLGILLIFSVLTLKLRGETPLTNEGAAFFVLAALEIVFLVFQTNRTYTYVPRNHMIDEQKNVEAMMNSLRKTLPVKINEDITEQSAFLKGRILVLEYAVKNMEIHNWNRDVLRPQMLGQACDYLNRYSKYNTIKAVFYTFGGDVKSFNMAIRADECSPTATNPPHADTNTSPASQHGPSQDGQP